MELLSVVGKLIFLFLPNIFIQLIVFGLLIISGVWVYRDVKKYNSGYALFWSALTILAWIPFFFLYLWKRSSDLSRGPHSSRSRFVFGLACFLAIIPLGFIGIQIYFVMQLKNAVTMAEQQPIENDPIVFAYFNENNQSGIKIKSVDRNGFAARLNLAEGDILTALDVEKIDSITKAYSIMPAHRGAAQHKLTIERARQSYTVTIPAGTSQSLALVSQGSRQVINYTLDGILKSCHEYVGYSDEQLRNKIKGCGFSNQTCSVSKEKMCSAQNIFLDCNRSRVEEVQDPLRTVFYETVPGGSWPSSFFSFQCKGRFFEDQKNISTQKLELPKTNQPASPSPNGQSTVATRLQDIAVSPLREKDGRMKGFRIVRITAGGFFEKAGLKEDDILLKADSVAMDSASLYMKFLEQTAGETKRKLEVERDGKIILFEISMN